MIPKRKQMCDYICMASLSGVVHLFKIVTSNIYIYDNNHKDTFYTYYSFTLHLSALVKLNHIHTKKNGTFEV